MPNCLKSSLAWLFADDNKMLHRISSSCQQRDIEQFRNDISIYTIEQYSKTWLLDFNIDKSACLHYGFNNPNANYTVCNDQIPTATSIRDLGVIMSSNLKFYEHSNKIAADAMKTSNEITATSQLYRWLKVPNLRRRATSYYQERHYKAGLGPDVERDWSDHAIWWPQKNRWLKHTRSTLDQCGMSADTYLYFTPMHKAGRVQLPDLQHIDVMLDFSIPSFETCVHLGQELGIRHPEELGFKRLIDPEVLKVPPPTDVLIPGPDATKYIYNLKNLLPPSQHSQLQTEFKNAFEEDGTGCHTQSALDLSPTGFPNHPPAYGTMPIQSTASYHDATQNGYPNSGAATLGHRVHTGDGIDRAALSNKYNSLPRGVGGNMPSHLRGKTPEAEAVKPSTQYFTLERGTTLPTNVAVAYEGLVHCEKNFVISPRVPVSDGLYHMLRPKNYIQKAALNRGWLDSSRSLMEQGIQENGLVLLRFKYLAFYDLNPKYDPVRLNQIYEQAKWSILAEELDYTDEEMIMFAAIQRQIQEKSENPSETADRDIDVETALDELESTLEGVHLGLGKVEQSDLTTIPELADYLKYMKPKKVGIKGWRRCYFTFKDLSVAYYSNIGDKNHGQPLGRIFLKGCEVTPDLNLKENKFVIKLLIPSAEGMSDFWIRCESQSQYANWMAGIKLASKGRTMADASYQAEVESLRRMLDMQQPTPSSSGNVDFNPDELLPQRASRKLESRNQLAHRINEAHSSVRKLSLTEAKMHYIRAWQALPEYGIHYFVVKFRGCTKQELMGIAYDRMMKMQIESGHAIKTWRFANLRRWHVNWEILKLLVETDEEELLFSCHSAHCKVPHEFIGGYIFDSLRSKEQNQSLDIELFHRLTGGRHGITPTC